MEGQTQNAPILFRINAQQAGLRIDLVLRQLLPDHTRSYLQRLLEQGAVSVRGKMLGKHDKLAEGDMVCIRLPEIREPQAKTQEITLDIRYEDGDLLVVNKPRGMVVHPAAGNPDGTLVNALLHHCKGQLSGINGVLRPGIVHRIDKDTSGLLLVAKNDAAHLSLAKQIQAHSLRREYQAVILGHLKEPEGTVDAPIGRSAKDRKKMCVTTQHAREAVTHYSVIAQYQGYSHLCLRLETGRTHQIRVHMAYLGHPVAGDPVYGNKKADTALGGQCLHAALLGFLHPRDGREICIEAELPDYFTGFLQTLQPYY